MSGFANTVFAFVLLLGVLIFVHELGHFLVAKACGVRVLKFSLGFGSPVGFGRYRALWRRGNTDYVIAWFPLGGFVKMLGENPDEAEDPALRADPSETLGAKPTWQKLAIVFAGPAMNLMLPVLVFMATLAVGMPQAAPEIGMVEPGSPAERVGLRPDDVITAAGGKPIAWWGELDDALRDRPGERVRLDYRRGAETGQVEVELGARTGLDEFGEQRPIGWAGFGHGRVAAKLGVANAGSAAYRAGLRTGDQVERVGDGEVDDWESFAKAYTAAGTSGEVELAIARGEGDERVTQTLRVPARGKLDALGLAPATVLIARVSPDSPAADAGLRPGDLIVSVGGERVGSFAAFAEIVRVSEGSPLEFGVAREGSLERVTIAPKLERLDRGLGIEESRYMIGIEADSGLRVGALETDRVRNPLVSFPRAVGMTVDITHTFIIGIGKLIRGEVSRKQLAGPIGIAEIAGQAYERGWQAYLSIMVLISINLGILNLLPIPVLDGGQAMIFIVEAIKRGPLSIRTREIAQQIGVTVLLLLMGLAFWNDLSRQWTRLLDWLDRGSGL